MKLGREAWTGVFPGVPRRKQPWLWTWSFLNYERIDFCWGEGRSQSCVSLFFAGLGNQCTRTFRYHLCSTYKVPWPRSSVMAPGSEAGPENRFPHSTFFCCSLLPSAVLQILSLFLVESLGFLVAVRWASGFLMGCSGQAQMVRLVPLWLTGWAISRPQCDVLSTWNTKTVWITSSWLATGCLLRQVMWRCAWIS